MTSAGPCPACGYPSMMPADAGTRCPECGHRVSAGGCTLAVLRPTEAVDRHWLARGLKLVSWGGLIVVVASFGGAVAGGLTGLGVIAWIVWTGRRRRWGEGLAGRPRTVLVLERDGLEEWVKGRRRRRWHRSRIAGWNVAATSGRRWLVGRGDPSACVWAIGVRFRGRLGLGKGWVVVPDESIETMRARLEAVHGLAD